MYCPKCGCENNDGANFCASCGYNYTTGTSENVSKRKKNVKLTEKKKKPNGCLTALIVVIIIFGVFFVALLSGDDSSSGAENTTNNSQVDNVQQNDDEKVYGIGDTVTVNTSRGDYSLKFTGVRETSKRNQYADDNPQRVVILEYEYKNISFDSDVVVSYLYLRTYDNDGNALAVYPDTSIKPTTNISQGKTATASVAYGLNSDDNIVTVDFYNITMESMHNAECSFKLTW